MIERLLAIRPRVIHQERDEDGAMESPICACNDETNLIVLSQEGREIIVHRRTVPDLIKVLRELATEVPE